MEIKDGRITPSSEQEASFFSTLLEEQSEANQMSAAMATLAFAGHELTNSDTYKLLCAIECRVNLVGTPNAIETNPEEAAICRDVIQGLAKDSTETDRPAIDALPADLAAIAETQFLRLAFRSLEQRYEN